MSSTKPSKQSFLPPKSPFPTVPPGYAPSARGQRHHQRTSSESFLIEEQPSWLDELLDEPETPVRRPAHRRASSDSFTYFDPAGAFDHAAYYAEAGAFGRPLGGGWEKGANVVGYSGSVPVGREAEGVVGAGERVGQEEAGRDLKGSPERKPEADTKRVKQQFAQRSRVRKLQYIAELERHVQALHAKGLEVSAELEFLDQQNLILNLENKTLKQRLDSLVQAQHIKHLQQEMLEREIARLKLQQQQQSAPTHVRRSSRDLDFQFANLSLKHKEANSARDPLPDITPRSGLEDLVISL